MNDIDYKAVMEIAESFINNEKVEILGISVGEERQVKQAIKNLIQRNKDLEQIEKEHKEENGRLRDKIKDLEKEIIYWKEQAEGYQGLAEQIKEDFENRDRWE